MQTGIFGLCFDSLALRAGFVSAILLCSAPPAKLLGQNVGSSTGSVFHIHGVVLNAQTNKPVDRALVTSMEMAALTDSEGRFEFDVRSSNGIPAGGPVPSSGFSLHGEGRGGYTIALVTRRPGRVRQPRHEAAGASTGVPVRPGPGSAGVAPPAPSVADASTASRA